eukprot:4353469-Pleurochrysis_carterae.AAC.1
MTRSPPAVRSGATMAALLRRRRINRSVIVPSFSSACAGVFSSFTPSGGDGAIASISSALSSTMLSSICGGAVGGCVPGLCGLLGGTGGEG